VKVNCASIPKDLFESEFFGHVRGSVHGRRRRPRRFRLDLLYRISVFPIYVPALRERREDIALLATRFLRTGGLRLQRTVSSIPEREMTKLVAYDWPGNIRELQHVVERAAILASQRGTVQFDVTPSSTEPKRAERPGSPLPNRGRVASDGARQLAGCARGARWKGHRPRWSCRAARHEPEHAHVTTARTGPAEDVRGLAHDFAANKVGAARHFVTLATDRARTGRHHGVRHDVVAQFRRRYS